MWISGRKLSIRLLKDLDKWELPEFKKYLQSIFGGRPYNQIEALFYDDYAEIYDEYKKNNTIKNDGTAFLCLDDLKIGILFYIAAGSTAIFRIRKVNEAA